MNYYCMLLLKFRMIEQAKEQQQRPGTCILFEEWGTSGKVRPHLSTLRNLLAKAELYRAADYVSELLNGKLSWTS